MRFRFSIGRDDKDAIAPRLLGPATAAAAAPLLLAADSNDDEDGQESVDATLGEAISVVLPEILLLALALALLAIFVLS